MMVVVSFMDAYKIRIQKRTSLRLTKCFALNTSEGYISGGENPNRSIRAFGFPGVRARKLGGLK